MRSQGALNQKWNICQGNAGEINAIGSNQMIENAVIEDALSIREQAGM